MKVCTKCGFQCENDLVLEFFNFNRTNGDGYAPWCKQCSQEYSREYRQKHEPVRGRISKTIYEASPVGKAKRRAIKARQRAAKRGVTSTLTAEEWQDILTKAGNRCTYCGVDGKMTQDHVLPLSRGGTHSKENVVPACGPCNDSKGAKTPEEWRA